MIGMCHRTMVTAIRKSDGSCCCQGKEFVSEVDGQGEDARSGNIQTLVMFSLDDKGFASDMDRAPSTSLCGLRSTEYSVLGPGKLSHTLRDPNRRSLPGNSNFPL